ncbi:MAG: hypothetical protein AAFQ45_12150 [Pseudomonadota bacterium]
MRPTTILLGIVIAGGLAFALRNHVPFLISLVDFGGPQIGATDPRAKLERPQRAATRTPTEEPALPPPIALKRVPAGKTPITLAHWTFEAPDIVVPKKEEPAWRTSFGSERKTRAQTATAAGFDADLIALTGVRNFKLLRRAFPARDYFLITSPQLRSLALAGLGREQGFAHAAMAFAIRRGSGVRARQRVQAVFASGGGGAALSTTPDDLKMAGQVTTLPFAVQVLLEREVAWVVAHAASDTCASADDATPACRAEAAVTARLVSWIKQRRRSGQTVILATRGPVDRGLPASADQHLHATTRPQDAGCDVPNAALRIWTSPADDDWTEPVGTVWRRRDGGGACVLLARLALEPRPPPPPVVVTDDAAPGFASSLDEAADGDVAPR